ncbi:hypothetical protein HY839_00750 [Candidatus Azambacteria bacterium]|nr:hypothetical protein [Candidatus Azambacteria bacterium]
MNISLHEELGLKKQNQDERGAAPENDACKKCGTTILGALTGRRISTGEVIDGNGEHAFTIIPYCPNCEEKPTGPREGTEHKK